MPRVGGGPTLPPPGDDVAGWRRVRPEAVLLSWSPARAVPAEGRPAVRAGRLRLRPELVEVPAWVELSPPSRSPVPIASAPCPDLVAPTSRPSTWSRPSRLEARPVGVTAGPIGSNGSAPGCPGAPSGPLGRRGMNHTTRIRPPGHPLGGKSFLTGRTSPIQGSWVRSPIPRDSRQSGQWR